MQKQNKTKQKQKLKQKQKQKTKQNKTKQKQTKKKACVEKSLIWNMKSWLVTLTWATIIMVTTSNFLICWKACYW